MSTKRFTKTDDLFELKSVTDPRVSPNGKEALFIQTTIDEKKNKYISNLFLLNLESNETQQLTFGKETVTQPRWSADGNKILFLSNREEKNQAFILPRFGGEAKQVTDEDSGISQAAFSPNGNKLAYQSSITLEKLQSNDEEEEKDEDDKDFPKPTVIERMKYKADSAGLLEVKFQQIKLLDLESEESEVLLQGEKNYIFQTWLSDGKKFIYSTDEKRDQDFNFNQNIYFYNLEDKTSEELPTDEGYASSFTQSPDGKHLLFVHMGREYENATHAELYHYDLDNKITTCLTESLDAPVGDYVVGDFLQQTVLQGAVWSSDKDFYFPVSNQGSVHLYYGNLDGELYPALQDNLHINGFDLASGQKAVLTISTLTNPSEIYTLDVTNGELTQVSNVNEEYLDSVDLVEPETIEYTSKDGWKVHGWFMKPAGYKDGEKYPMVVNIHGGPHAFYANTFFHEMQVIAAKGYAVLYVNPRGSHSYGQEFVDAVRGDYGNGDYLDIMNGVDYILEQNPWIDENRLGVTGGSYGGFMTNWIIGHTNRFKAAVTQRSISNWISFRGVSDIGYYFTDWQIQAKFNDVEKMWKHSPIAYVDQMQTPLLIIHNERDFRCPVEQAEQLYIALKYQKKQTKFVRFPESDHNLSRTGKPNLRIERLNHITGWFDDYLA
ncbi:peptidase [Halalkalibacillus sediminis]|uniref:Peptidase n=1 Tax=Halalkalibacillus sediminis TaxID=2018042 RepID=A0A2I0QWR5_9BACI|nr:S9 family peptidase [Halalkalibacillus sediminis]PKR78786.1 peptidase [Halalkalibacillus sediminis]